MNAPEHPTKFTVAERIAAASVVALIVGLLLPKATSHSLDRAILFWLIACVFVGLIVGAPSLRAKLRVVIQRAALPSGLLPVAFLGYIIARAIVDIAKSGNPLDLEITLFSGVQVNLLSPTVILALVGLWLLGSAATLLLIVLASVGSRPIIAGLARVNSFGPEGFDRATKIIVAITGSLTALLALWLALGS